MSQEKSGGDSTVHDAAVQDVTPAGGSAPLGGRADIWEALRARWPSAIVARREVRNFTGGLLDPRHLANMDSQGKGPAGRYTMGRAVFYTVDGLIDWMSERTTAQPPR